MQSEIDNLQSLKRDLLSTMKCFEERQKRLEAKTDSNPETITEIMLLTTDFTNFRSSALTCLENLEQLLLTRLDALEQYSRKNCLIVHGVKEDNDESIVDVVVNFINEKMKIPNFVMEPRLIDNVHRLGYNKRDKARPRSIIIKFLSYLDRRTVFINKKRLRGTGFLITESLTKARAQVFYNCKERLGKENCWTQDGKIIVLMPDRKKKTVMTTKNLELVFKEFDELIEKRQGTAYNLRSIPARN